MYSWNWIISTNTQREKKQKTSLKQTAWMKSVMSRASSWVMVNFYLYLIRHQLRFYMIHSWKLTWILKNMISKRNFPSTMAILGVIFGLWGNHKWSTKGHLFEELLWTCTKNPSTSIFMKDAPGKDEWIKGLCFLLLNFKHFGEAHLGAPYDGSFLGGAFGGSKMLSLWGWTHWQDLKHSYSKRKFPTDTAVIQKQQRCLTNQKNNITFEKFRHFFSPPKHPASFTQRNNLNQKKT